MKITKKQLSEIIQKALKEGDTITKPAPTITPGVKPSPTKKPNPLMPPKEAPKTRPKAVATEDAITDKIVKRFQSLKELKSR